MEKMRTRFKVTSTTSVAAGAPVDNNRSSHCSTIDGNNKGCSCDPRVVRRGQKGCSSPLFFPFLLRLSGLWRDAVNIVPGIGLCGSTGWAQSCADREKAFQLNKAKPDD